MRFLIAVVVLFGLVTGAAADPLRVGLHEDPPFALHEGDQWKGISVELLRAIATELGTTVEFHDLTPAQITTGPLPDVDIVTTLNVGQKMNARYELTHAFYSTGLAIVVPEPKKESVWSMIGRIFSREFVLILVGVLVLLTLVGLLMWWFEKRDVAPLPKERAMLSKALFWAFEPVIGYKASQHATRAGRILGTIWGVFGVVLVSGLTANLAAQLTTRRLATSVRGVEDLPRVRVAIVEHTTSGRFCDRRGIKRNEFPTLEAALVALEQGKVDAVLDDEINIKYVLRTGHEHLTLLPGTFFPHSGAFGLKPDSPLRHDFNAALLKVLTTDSWTALMASYLGKVD